LAPDARVVINIFKKCGDQKKSSDTGRYTRSSDNGAKRKGNSVSHRDNVQQDISQSNYINASNSGSGDSATANDNSQSNDATNTTTVHIHNGGQGNCDQEVWRGDSNNGGSRIKPQRQCKAIHKPVEFN